jgi:phosphoglycolate phosphatase-like HAD superfamily hydrolase
MNYIKIWQRSIDVNGYSKLREVPDLSFVDGRKPLALCLPGLSTIHTKKQEINGYMKLIEKMLGGRSIHNFINIVAVSYGSSSIGEKNIDFFNRNPLSFYCEGTKEFTTNVISPLIKSNIDINVFCKSYGIVFARMLTNALHNLGVRAKPYQIRVLAMGNVSRLNYTKRNNSTEIIVEGVNDNRAKKLNFYKIPPPKNHKRITIVPVSENLLCVLVDLNNYVVIRKNHLRTLVADDERHTALLYCSPGKSNFTLINFIRRVASNMILYRGKEFNIKKILSNISSSEYSGKGGAIKKRLQYAVMNGEENLKIKAVLFDWDLTLANGEYANLLSLNRTFSQMHEEYCLGSGRSWNYMEMRRLFIPTVPIFFKKIYPNKYEEAIRIFKKERLSNISEVKLVEGVKQLLSFLINNDIPIAIVSNKEHDELKTQVELTLCDPLFKNIPIIGNTPKGRYKPNLNGIYDALSVLGIKRNSISSVMFVGDRVSTDINAALSAGCIPCLIGENDKCKLLNITKNVLEDASNFLKIQDELGKQIVWFSSIIHFYEYLLRKTVRVSGGMRFRGLQIYN